MEVIHHTSTEAARDTLALIHYKVEGNDEKFNLILQEVSRLFRR